MRNWRLRRVNWRRFCDQFQRSRERSWTGLSTKSLVTGFVAIIPWLSPGMSTGSLRRELFWNLPKPCCGGIFEDSVSSPGTPWTNAEIEQLKRSGVELLLPTTRHAGENLATLRAVLGAKKQLVFMSPRMVGNEPAPHHPFRDRIQSLIDGNLPIFDLDRHLADPVRPLQPGQLVAPNLHAFPRLRLPGIRRWWKLNGGQYLDSRDLESFTSAENVYLQSRRLGTSGTRLN